MAEQSSSNKLADKTSPAAKAPNLNKIYMLSAGGAVIIAAIVLILIFVVFGGGSISAKAVSSAKATMKNLASNEKAAFKALDDSSSADTTAELNSDLSTAGNKLSAAEADYATLQKSDVLNDAATKASFDKMSTKWNSFNSYMQTRLKGDKALGVILLDFTAKLNKLKQAQLTTIDDVNAYLDSFKALADNALSQLNSTTVTLTGNKLLASTYKTYLRNVSQMIAVTKNDLASGDKLSAETELDQIDSEQSTLEDGIDAADNKISDREDQIDPADALTSFQKSLDNLASRMNK